MQSQPSQKCWGCSESEQQAKACKPSWLRREFPTLQIMSLGCKEYLILGVFKGTPEGSLRLHRSVSIGGCSIHRLCLDTRPILALVIFGVAICFGVDTCRRHISVLGPAPSLHGRAWIPCLPFISRRRQLGTCIHMTRSPSWSE